MTANHRDGISFSSWSIPEDVDILFREGVAIPLEPQAVRVLRYLAHHDSRVVSKDELLEKIWPDVYTTDGVLKRAISQIRRALGDTPSDARFIATYHGRGYRFLHESAHAVPDSAPAALRSLPEFDQLVGRESELTLLEAELASALRGNPRPVMILGDAGIGKTQLARHFQRRSARADARTPYLRFFDYRASQILPYQAFVDLIAEMNQSTAVAGNRLRARMSGSDALGDPYRLIVPICRELEALARERPLIFVLDDLQWATEAELDLVSYLLRSAGDHQLMLIITTRLEDLASPCGPLGAWMRKEAARRSFTTLELHPLAEDGCRLAIDSVFGSSGSPPIPESRLEEIFDVARGNPFFLMEILRLLIADGLLRLEPDSDRWLWTDTGVMKLPESMVLLAESRLERLGENVRAVVDAAAVLGDEFRILTLVEMTGIEHEALERILEDCIHQGALTRRGVSSGDDCRFYHALIRRIVYERISEPLRRSLHALAARALQKVYLHDRDRVAEAVSVHYEVAGETQPTFDSSLEAWRAASGRWDWRRALAAVERAGRAASALEQRGVALPDDRRMELNMALGETLFSVGRLREADEILSASVRSLSGKAESNALGDLLLLRGRCAIGLSRYLTAADDLRQAAEVFGRTGKSAGELRARIELGGVEAAMGRYETASEILTMALSELDPDSDLSTLAYGIFGWATALQGNYAVGARLLEKGIDASNRGANLRHRALLIRRLHWVELTRGNYESAVALALLAREDFRRIGDVAGEAKTNMGLGQARMAQGIYAEAIAHLHETLNNLGEIGDSHCEAETLWLLGRATLESGDIAGAAPLLARSLEMVRGIGDRDDEFRILTDLARLHIAQANASGATQAAREAEAIARELRNNDGMGLATAELARGELLAGNISEAVVKARIAVELLEHSGLGERWRATGALGECLMASLEPREAAREFRRAVDLLEAVRDEAPVQHREVLCRAHSRIPIQLESTLRDLDRQQEADALRRGWNLGSDVYPS